jgi:hypothetical protein
MSLTAHGHPSSKTHYIPLKNDNQDKPTTAQRGKAKDNASGQPVEQGTGQTSKRTIYNTLRTSFMDFGKTIDRACTRVENFMRHITRDDRRARYVLRKICNDLQDLYKDDPGAVLWAASDKRRTYKKHVVAIGVTQSLEFRKKPADSNKHDVDDKLDIGIHLFKNNILSKEQIKKLRSNIKDTGAFDKKITDKSKIFSNNLIHTAINNPDSIKDWKAVIDVYHHKMVGWYGESDASKILNKAKLNASFDDNSTYASMISKNGKEFFNKLLTYRNNYVDDK